MESNTTLKERKRRKTDSRLVSTIELARKQTAWNLVAFRLSGPTRKHAAFNLNQIDTLTKEGDTVIVPGKVLGVGQLHKKITICALSYSESVKQKLKNAKIAIHSIEDEIRSNPKANGVVVL
jgi:large subunit ribosomal protein L18e